MKFFRKLAYVFFPLVILTAFFSGCGDSSAEFKKERDLMYYKVRNVTGLTTKEMIFQSTKRKDYPLFIIEEGELYLIRQITWPEFLGTKVKPFYWDDAQLKDLIKKNDLYEYFPEIDTYYAGVEWLVADESKRKGANAENKD